jgi:PhoPQ-activated pathogenicity-related protein
MSPRDHLNQFVSNREGFGWSRSGNSSSYSLRSGRWRSSVWQHSVILVSPTIPSSSKTVILYITGGVPNALDIEEASRIANRSHLVVAMLFDIPNQPLFDRTEDDLIAHTFEQFIDTGDYSWPLLFPMVRAAIRCIDMLVDLGFQRCVITGASKRGWTTWLAASTGDPRIAGIAPMVIDNLNFPAQMAHQVSCWGGYSEQIQDYTSRELQSEMDSDLGSELTIMMDPINYLDSIDCPILIINGANDRYWTVDALSLYWGRLARTSRCLIVPNVGHILGDKVQMVETLAAFSFACDKSQILPAPRRLTGSSDVGKESLIEVRLWTAASDTLDFRNSEWIASPPNDRVVDWLISSDSSLIPGADPVFNKAAMAEFRFHGPTGPYSLSTPIRVMRSTRQSPA